MQSGTEQKSCTHGTMRMGVCARGTEQKSWEGRGAARARTYAHAHAHTRLEGDAGEDEADEELA